MVLLQNCSSLDLAVDVDVDVETLTILFAFRQFRLCFFRFLAFFIRNLVLRDFSNEPKESERDAAAGGGGGEEMVYAGGRVFYCLLVCEKTTTTAAASAASSASPTTTSTMTGQSVAVAQVVERCHSVRAGQV